MTDADRRRRLHDLFVEASERTGPERDTLLHRVDEEEPALGPALRRLLDAEEAVQREGFLDSGAGGPGLWPAEGEVDPDLGRSVGPYRLLRLLGTGGMGRVYLAERRDEFEQLVAIKLIRPGMVTDELLDRFRVERQMMAALDHPNIARLLDGGTDDGRPYFVMEYVDGVRIDEYCDRHDLAVRDRVALLATVCDAVGHAHENIVVHRDIKPANILVTADGVPKLLDFGLARLLNPVIGATGAAPAGGGPRFLTASYASPEQLVGDTVGRPADVWSLGVILYELLTGRPPFELDGRTHPEVERIVRDVRPAPPSRVVRHPEPDEAGADLHGRAPDRRELSRDLAGDLDAIVRLAMRPEPRDRYPDAGALGNDLRRWLRHEPVSARRETMSYVAARFVRRHRALVALTAAVVLALAAGLVGTTVAMLHAFDQRDRAAAAMARGIDARLAAADAERRAEAARRRSLSKRLAGEVLLDSTGDPELDLLLAIEAVDLSPTPAAELALRRTLVRSEPSIQLQGPASWVDGAAFSPDGKRIVSVSDDGRARVWEAGSGRDVAVLEPPAGAVTAASFSPDGRHVVTGGTDGTARIWDSDTGAPLAVLGPHEGPVLDAAFSPDGRWVITAGADGALRLWDPDRGRERPEFARRGPVSIADVLYSPDGALIGEALSDRTGRVLDAATGEELAIIRGHGASVNDAAFSPDATRIVTASDDRTARVWEARTGRQQLVLRRHGGPVRTCEFSPDGAWIVTAGNDDLVCVWDAATGECLHVEGGHAASFSPDGRWLVVAGSHGTVSVRPWEHFAPLAHNLAVARTRVTRALTPDERDRFLRELTDDERRQRLRELTPDR